MPQRAWSKKRERQYEPIKEGVLEQKEDEDTAEEIAARTVNKERARVGEARQSSRTSTDDISSGRRGACARIAALVAAHAPSCTTRHASATSRAARR